MKNYPPQFKADAVALYQSRPGATIRQVAADLGINPETLRNWVRAAGASRPRGAARRHRPSRPPRWRRRTRPCARRSASWKKSGRSCGRRPSISPGRRAGEEPSIDYCMT
ncbi:transposase [Streptomyces sp. NPDC026673]|uniref:transposase n=1 Tax=Streptomyces sp. NPDC026673 TaxID=3155724 RepID=UPI00340E0203